MVDGHYFRHFGRKPVIIAVLSLCTALIAGGCSSKPSIPTQRRAPIIEYRVVGQPIRDAVRGARSQGNATATVVSLAEAGGWRSLKDVAKSSSVLIVVPSVEVAATLVYDGSILDFAELELVETLTRRPAPDGACDFAPPSGMKLGNGTLGMVVGGGTAEIDGVKVTYRSSEPNLRLIAGQRYVVLGHVCPSGLIRLSGGTSGVVELDVNGVLRPTMSTDYPTLQLDLVRVGTLANLRRFLNEIHP